MLLIINFFLRAQVRGKREENSFVHSFLFPIPCYIVTQISGFLHRRLIFFNIRVNISENEGRGVKKRAYISVFDKDGIIETVQNLIKKGFEIISTGGTFKFLKENGINAIEVSQVTGCPEMLRGKVKSLHPAIFGGILADLANSDEAAEIQKLNIYPFELVMVNLYPFEKIASQTDNAEDLIDNIDIGGVALLRAAAKNYKNVIVICDKKDYGRACGAPEDIRQELALKAFALTSKYDAIIRTKLGEIWGECNEVKDFAFEKIQDLRYGENPHQKAGLYKINDGGGVMSSDSSFINLPVRFSFLQGKELSYNNILDTTAAVNIVSEFYDVPAAAIVKHSMPCGVALGTNISDAYQKALDCDPISAFGGIAAFSQGVNVELAKHLNSIFLEVIIAPDFDTEALEIFKNKKNLRIIKLETPLVEYKKAQNEEVKITPFGVLIQGADKKELDKDTFKVVTKTKPSAEQIEDAIFAWKIVKHAKSNAVVIAKDFKTLAIGQGQTSRIAAMEWALNHACDAAKGAVAASDGFLPALDNIHAAAQGRISLIIQPGGSIKDSEVIAQADKYDLIMITTGIRHFKH